MKTIQELNKSKVPIVIIDPKLEKLNEQVLFPEKVEKARQTIAKIGLPKQEHNNRQFASHARSKNGESQNQ